MAVLHYDRFKLPIAQNFIFNFLFILLCLLFLFNNIFLVFGVRVATENYQLQQPKLSSVARRQSSYNSRGNSYTGSENGSSSTELAISDVSTVTFVLVISEQSELPVYYEIIKPTLELAIKDATRRYAHLKFNLISIKDNNKCADNVLGALAAEKFYTTKV